MHFASKCANFLPKNIIPVEVSQLRGHSHLFEQLPQRVQIRVRPHVVVLSSSTVGAKTLPQSISELLSWILASQSRCTRAKHAQKRISLHGLLLSLQLVVVVLINQLSHLVLLAHLVARYACPCHILHQARLHRSTFFCDLLCITDSLELLLFFDLTIDLDWGTETEHHFEVADILAE